MWKKIKKGELRHYDGRRARVSVPWPTEALPALPQHLKVMPRRLVEGRLRGTRLVAGGIEVPLTKKVFQEIEVWSE